MEHKCRKHAQKCRTASHRLFFCQIILHAGSSRHLKFITDVSFCLNYNQQRQHVSLDLNVITRLQVHIKQRPRCNANAVFAKHSMVHCYPALYLIATFIRQSTDKPPLQKLCNVDTSCVCVCVCVTEWANPIYKPKLQINIHKTHSNNLTTLKVGQQAWVSIGYFILTQTYVKWQEASNVFIWRFKKKKQFTTKHI